MATPLASLARLAAFAADWPLSAALRIGERGKGSHRERRDGQCVALINQDVYFGVEVGVGTPPQVFTLVADTGSNSVVVVSCECTTSGQCNEADHCYSGSSSTLSRNDPVPRINLSFGSGSIQAEAVTDDVVVGDIHVTMPEGVLLLVDDSALELGKARFEGILGLGLPGAGELSDPDPSLSDAQAYNTDSLMEVAGTASFSMCFGGGLDGGPGSYGALRLNAALEDTMRYVGQAHWGVGLSGITVGGSGTGGGIMLTSCSDLDPGTGTDTPCGLIPDSGTTAIIGPPARVTELHASMCFAWPLCNDTLQELVQDAANGEAPSWDDVRDMISLTSKGGMGKVLAAGPSQHDRAREYAELLLFAETLFQGILNECDIWQNDDNGHFEALPSVHLTITDADGETRLLEVTKRVFIFEVMAPSPAADESGMPSLIRRILRQKLARADPAGTASGEDRPVCVSTIMGMSDYLTEANGPVWIFGMPLFYQYEVGFDLVEKRLSFTKLEEGAGGGGGCQACSADPTGGTQQTLSAMGTHRQRRFRRLKGTPRKPTIDTTKPF